MGMGFLFDEKTLAEIRRDLDEEIKLDICDHGVPRKQCGSCCSMAEAEQEEFMKKLRAPTK
jgi:hypothetical protein